MSDCKTKPNSESSLELLFEAAQANDDHAIDKLARMFLDNGRSMAKGYLVANPSPMVDADDVIQSAVRSLCAQIQAGNVTFLDKQQLLGLFRTIFKAKSAEYWRNAMAQKRNSARTLNESQLEGEDSENPALAGFCFDHSKDSLHVNDDSASLGSGEQEIFAKILAELQLDLHGIFKELLNRISDHRRRRDVLQLLVNSQLNTQEIASRLGFAVATIERDIRFIKDTIAEIGSEHDLDDVISG